MLFQRAASKVYSPLVGLLQPDERNDAIRDPRNGGDSMKVSDTLFIFGLVFVGIPVFGLVTVFVEIFRGVL